MQGLVVLSALCKLRCNQFGFFQAGAPENHSTIVSRFLTAEHSEVHMSFRI